MGVGAFSNADHLLALRTEMRDGQKNWDDANDCTLKGSVGNIIGTYHILILCARNIGAWLNISSTVVTCTVLLDTTFLIYYAHVTMLPPSISRDTEIGLTPPLRYVTHIAAAKEA